MLQTLQIVAAMIGLYCFVELCLYVDRDTVDNDNGGSIDYQVGFRQRCWRLLDTTSSACMPFIHSTHSRHCDRLSYIKRRRQVVDAE